MTRPFSLGVLYGDVWMEARKRRLQLDAALHGRADEPFYCLLSPSPTFAAGGGDDGFGRGACIHTRMV